MTNSNPNPTEPTPQVTPATTETPTTGGECLKLFDDLFDRVDARNQIQTSTNPVEGIRHTFKPNGIEQWIAELKVKISNSPQS